MLHACRLDLAVLASNLKLVPLLVPLCTGFWFFFMRRGAMWISNPSHSFCCRYSVWCRAVQRYASGSQIGLKIRRPLPVVGVQVPLRAPKNQKIIAIYGILDGDVFRLNPEYESKP
jgi:hypothetical protein